MRPRLLRQSIAVLAFALCGPASAHAQSIGARVAVVNVTPYDRRSTADSLLHISTDSSARRCGTACTVVIGALVGGVAGAGSAASQSYHPDDDIGINRGLAIGLCSGIGVVIGALAGAIIAAVR